MNSYERGGPEIPDNMQQMMESPGRFLGLLGALLVVTTIGTSYFQVDADSVGVVLRFGQHIETHKPGLHFKLPFGIDRVIPVPVDRQ